MLGRMTAKRSKDKGNFIHRVELYKKADDVNKGQQIRRRRENTHTHTVSVI